MQPRRPDSAKSRNTQKTLDTELNQSKFSQTFTSYSTFQTQKKDEFLKYLQQKDKDPKFKKYVQTNLPQIPQKQPKQQLAKINSKPFEKRTSKIIPKTKNQSQNKQTNNKVLGTNPESTNANWTFNQPNSNKKQNKQEMTSSQSFAQKNKQKMNSVTAALKKSDNQQKKSDKKIQFKGFKVNVPGKRLIKNNQEQKQSEKQSTSRATLQEKQTQHVSESQKKNKRKQKTEEQLRRQQQLMQISRFINEVEMRNIDYYPDAYEQFVQKNESQSPENLEKIDINDFLIEPTERDYQKIQRKIRENEKKLTNEDQITESKLSLSLSSLNNPSNEQTSIDLDNIIDGDFESETNQQTLDRNELFLSSISSKDLKQRNLFLTEVMKGRVTKQDIMKLEEMQKSQLKMKKIEQTLKEEEDDVEVIEINMIKKKSNRLFERNMVEATGQIYRDCDYLSQQNKLRLQKLLNGQIDPSPFELSEWEKIANRRIDEGIRIYRQFSSSSRNKDFDVIPEECLPKDPNLRKEAQKKFLKQKIESINSRLRQVENIVVNQVKIQQIIEQYRSSGPTEFTESLVKEYCVSIQEIQQKTKLAAEMLMKAQKQKSSIEQTLRQIQYEYKLYEKECQKYEKMTVDQIVKRQKQEIEEKRKRIQNISKELRQIETGVEQNISEFHRHLQGQISVLREIENLALSNQIEFKGLPPDQTIEELDAIFQKKLRQDPEQSESKRNLLSGQQKQN